MIVVELDLKVIFFISAAIVAAIRMTCYIPKFGQNISKEIAKLLPLNLLAFALINPGFFDTERILNNFNKIGGFFPLIMNYLFFIVILETLLRLFEFLFLMFGIEDE